MFHITVTKLVRLVVVALVAGFDCTVFGWCSRSPNSFISKAPGDSTSRSRTPLYASTGQSFSSASDQGDVRSEIFPRYGLASENLSEKWLDLVRNGKVCATVTLEGTSPEERSANLRYGVRMVKRNDSIGGQEVERCEEFVEQLFDENDAIDTTTNPLIDQINKTLASLQAGNSNKKGSTAAVKFSRDGPFAAQLQLVRTLRPPPSPGFGVKSSSIPPPYDSSSDSFVTGPLRLELRPLTTVLKTPELHTPWDVCHNVSPADSRGHFLLVPTLSDKANNRGQILTPKDCHDLVHLASTVSPAGSLLINYNSVGAGASQNHVHCHAWPSPPLPLMNEGNGWECYAASKVKNIHDFVDIKKGAVEVSFLEYPCCCIELSSTDPAGLAELGKALSVILQIVGNAPHNICILNRPSTTDNAKNDVDVYVFVRQRERSNVLPALKMGASEMMGVFHAQSDEELQKLAPSDPDGENEEEGPMARALRDVSYEPRWDLWDAIKARLTLEFED